MKELLRVFVFPGTVFESMRSHIPVARPLVVLVLSVCVFTTLGAWYLSDEEYLRVTEASLEDSRAMTNLFAEFLEEVVLDGESSDEEMEEARSQMQDISEMQQEMLTSEESIRSARKVQTVFAPMISIFVYGLILLVEATYFLIAGNMMQSSKQWSDWIAFSLWTTLPLVLYLVLSTLPTVLFGTLNPYHWQAPLAWIPGLETNALALTLTIPTLWIVWIRIAGMHKWIEKPVSICLLVVLIPGLVSWLISSAVVYMQNPYTM